MHDTAARAGTLSRLGSYSGHDAGEPWYQSGRARLFLLVSTITLILGLGWTLLRACKRQLLSDSSRGRDIRSIHTAAVIKAHDQHLFDEFGGWESQWDSESRTSELMLRV